MPLRQVLNELVTSGRKVGHVLFLIELFGIISLSQDCTEKNVCYWQGKKPSNLYGKQSANVQR
jgi:hypothetical protein